MIYEILEKSVNDDNGSRVPHFLETFCELHPHVMHLHSIVDFLLREDSHGFKVVLRLSVFPVRNGQV